MTALTVLESRKYCYIYGMFLPGCPYAGAERKVLIRPEGSFLQKACVYVMEKKVVQRWMIDKKGKIQ